MARNKKLPSGIEQLNSGRFRVRPYDRKNKKKGKAHVFDTLSEAVAFKEKVEVGQIDPSQRAWTCDEWVEHWTTDAAFSRRKESTNVYNAERVKQFSEDFEGIPLTAISRARARTWANKHVGRVASVRAMLNDAVREGALDTNPFEHIKVPRGPGRKFIKPMTEKEVAGLAECAYEKWPDWPVMGDMILFAAYTGVRRGELLGLKWADIDWERGTILVERQWVQRTRKFGTTKNGRARLVPLLPIPMEILRRTDRHQSPEEDLIWYSPRGKNIEPSLLDYYWRQVRERFLGTVRQERIEEIDLEWHTLRHFCISWLVDRGAPTHDIAEMVGHTDGGRLIQELYGHLYPDNSIARIQKSALAA